MSLISRVVNRPLTPIPQPIPSFPQISSLPQSFTPSAYLPPIPERIPTTLPPISRPTQPARKVLHSILERTPLHAASSSERTRRPLSPQPPTIEKLLTLIDSKNYDAFYIEIENESFSKDREQQLGFLLLKIISGDNAVVAIHFLEHVEKSKVNLFHCLRHAEKYIDPKENEIYYYNISQILNLIKRSTTSEGNIDWNHLALTEALYDIAHLDTLHINSSKTLPEGVSEREFIIEQQKQKEASLKRIFNPSAYRENPFLWNIIIAATNKGNITLLSLLRKHIPKTFIKKALISLGEKSDALWKNTKVISYLIDNNLIDVEDSENILIQASSKNSCSTVAFMTKYSAYISDRAKVESLTNAALLGYHDIVKILIKEIKYKKADLEGALKSTKSPAIATTLSIHLNTTHASNLTGETLFNCLQDAIIEQNTKVIEVVAMTPTALASLSNSPYARLFFLNNLSTNKKIIFFHK